MSNTFKLRNGRILLSTEAPGGIYNSSQLKKIASLCDGDSVTVKATEDQRLALIVNPEKAAFVASELKSMGLGVRHYQDGLHQPVSCIGELCEFHEQDALGSALDVSAELEGIKLRSPLKIGINGCAKCCVPCHTLDISVVGDSHGYRLSLGGKTSQLPEIAGFVAEGIPPTEIAKLVRSVVEIYRQNAVEGESLQELIERDGAKMFIDALAPWSQDASASEDPFDRSALSAAAFQSDTMDANEPVGSPTHESAKQQEIIADYRVPSEAKDDEAIHAAAGADFENNSDAHHEVQPSAITTSSAKEADFAIDIEVPAKSPNLNMDLILVHEDDFHVKDVEITNHQETRTPAQPAFIEAEVIDDNPIFQKNAEQDSASKESTPAKNISPEEIPNYADLYEDTQLPNYEVTQETEIHEPSEETLEESEAEADTQSDIQVEVQVEVQADATSLVENLAGSSDDSKEATDEERIEAQLIASITAHQNLFDADNLDTERDQSTQLLEQSEASLDANDLDGLNPDGIDHQSPSIEPPTTNAEPEAVSNNTVAVPLFHQKKPKQTLAIESFDFDENGNPAVTWSNGIILTLTPEAVSTGHIKFCGHDIQISRSNEGTRVQIDGISMLLPNVA